MMYILAMREFKIDFQFAGPPEVKLFVSVDVIGNSGVRLRICEDSAGKDKVIFTKYRSKCPI